jgi:hypothetical protein
MVTIIWDITSYSLVGCCTHCLIFVCPYRLPYVWATSFFVYPEDGRSTFNRNVGTSLPLYTAYSGSFRFQFRPGRLPSWLRNFVVFLSLLEPNGGIVPRLGHDCFLPNPCQSTLPTLYNLTAEGVVKQLTKDGRSKSLKTVIGFQFLTAVNINSTVFWVVHPCISEKARRFRGAYRLHILG